MEVGDNRSIQSLFFLGRVHMRSGVPHRGGLPGQPEKKIRNRMSECLSNVLKPHPSASGLHVKASFFDHGQSGYLTETFSPTGVLSNFVLNLGKSGRRFHRRGVGVGVGEASAHI